VRGGEKQSIAAGTSTSARAANALEEPGDGWWAVDLNDAIEIADVDAEFEGAGRHDHAVGGFGKGLFGSAAFVLAK